MWSSSSGGRTRRPTLATDIGVDWVAFSPFNPGGEFGAWERLERWGGEALAEAVARAGVVGDVPTIVERECRE
jgi:hypothetical protein